MAAAGGAPTLRRQPGAACRSGPGKAGLYIVGYQVASGDGHPVTGEVRFTLTTGTPADPSATAGGRAVGTGASAAPGVRPARPSPTAAARPTGEPDAGRRGTSESNGRGWLWALGGAGACSPRSPAPCRSAAASPP